MPDYAVMIIQIAVFFMAILMSSFFSLSEITFTSANKIRLGNEAEDGDKHAAKALKLATNFNTTSAAILFGNGLVNILTASVGTLLGIRLFAPGMGQRYAVVLSTVIAFLFIVIFGEILPKSIAKRYANGLAKAIYPLVTFFRYLFYPVVFIMSSVIRLFSFSFRKHVKEEVSGEELVEMVETIEKEGLIDETQGELIKSAIQFNDINAYEVMTPRVDIFGFDINDDPRGLLNHPDTFTYSKIPVYDENIDHIIGILPTKKLYSYLISPRPLYLRNILEKPLFVPRGITISSILKSFKDTKKHMAIVIDEFGGTEGLITIEDIIEEIVGEIWDESDEIEEEIIAHIDNSYTVDGAMNIEDFFELIDRPFNIDTDYNTVGGWCQERLGRFAVKGDTFRYLDFTISVLEAEPFIVTKIKVVLDEAND